VQKGRTSGGRAEAALRQSTRGNQLGLVRASRHGQRLGGMWAAEREFTRA